MYHFCARARAGTFLFHTWSEGLALWDRLIGAAPGLTALVIMPDHFHLLHPLDVRRRLNGATNAFARWRNAHRGEEGRVFSPLSRSDALTDLQKRRRSVRYVHLNPCRARLCADPLSWPLSTHRDAVGLALPAVRPTEREPARFHRYVSSDPHVHVDGTDLPGVTLSTTDLSRVLSAVSAITRRTASRVGLRGSARSLFVRSAVELCPTATRADVGAVVGIGERGVRMALHRGRSGIDAVARVLHDPRFPMLTDEDLRADWRRRQR